MAAVEITAQAATGWDAFVADRSSTEHRREAVRLFQRAEVTRMTDAEQAFWYGEPHRDRAERHLAAALELEAAVAVPAAQHAV
jgi:hypothetical protein